MKHIWQQRQIKHLIERRNGYLLLASISLLINVILSVVMMKVATYQKVILVPPVIERPIWVTDHQVSPEYLSGMALFLAHLLLNITPDNAMMQHKLFLRYVEPQFYDKFKTELVSIEERLKKEHLITQFQLSASPQIDANKLVARITGDVSYKVGNLSMPSKHLTYLLTFSYALGQLQVKSFEEEVKHA